MFILDTETMAELRKARMRRGNKALAEWASLVPIEDVYLSAITLQELEMGIRLSERDYPRRGKVLRGWMSRHVLPSFRDRILPINSAIALRAAEFHQQQSRTLSHAFIAATAYVHGFTVVSLYGPSLEGTGVNVIFPQQAQRK